MNAGAALDTFLFINLTDAILIICDRIYRTDLLTRPFQMCNGVVRTSLGTFSTLFALYRIDMGSVLSH
jgi:hypothetical protein